MAYITDSTGVTAGTFSYANDSESTVAEAQTWSNIFSNLASVLNGGLSYENFQQLLVHYNAGEPTRSWAKAAIRESKIQFDPYDGHDHSGHTRDQFDTGTILKKNLNPKSARVVWTAMQGLPAGGPAGGLTLIGGVHSIELDTTALNGGFTPGDVASTAWTNDTRCIIYGRDAWYWSYNTSGSTVTGGEVGCPFKMGVMPVVIANFLIPEMALGTAGANVYPAMLSTYGRWGVEQIKMSGEACTTSGLSPGFWVWWTNFGGYETFGTTADLAATLYIPWMAFGPGIEKTISWV